MVRPKSATTQCEWLIVDGRQCQFAVERRQHGLRQTANSGYLVVRQAVEESMLVLALLPVIESHGVSSLYLHSAGVEIQRPSAHTQPCTGLRVGRFDSHSPTLIK